MVVKSVGSDNEFHAEVNQPGGAVTLVDFYATWCGPCKKIAPFVEELSEKYKGANFIKVDADQCSDIVRQCGISAFPTFQVFKNGEKIDEMKGANNRGLEDMLVRCGASLTAGPAIPAGAGQSLGGSTWDGVGVPPSAKDQRANFLASLESKPSRVSSTPALPTPPVVAASTAMEIDEDAELARAIAMSVEESSAAASASAPASAPAPAPVQDAADDAEAKAQVDAAMEVWDGEEMVPLPVDEDLLKSLVEMGFSECRARKGIHHGTSLDGAVAWIEANQNDPNIDQPYMVMKKDTIPKVPLTPEEYAERIAATKAKIVQRRAERVAHEKKKAREDEIMRREKGKEMAQTQMERDALQRKRDMARLKKEKDDEKKEKQRILAQIKADKAIRKANGGKLHSVLGVDGYNPSLVAMGGEDEGDSGTSSSGAPAGPTIATGPPGPRVDNAIVKIMRHRTTGDGGNALKLLVTFIKNVVENPGEAKFRSINAEGNAFKNKIAPVTGGTIVLKAVGFVKNDENKYILPADADEALLKETLDKLTKAHAEFIRMNP